MTKYENFFVFYEDKKYDIADFINRHPGGVEVLIPYQGKDITAAFNHIHHSDDAKRLLFKRIVKPDIPEEKRRKLSQEEKELEEIKKQEEIDSENLGMSQRKFIIKKLFTQEDTFHMHKILGFFSIISYIYRYFYVFPTTGTLGFQNDYFSYATLLLHTMLSVSSLIFHVLKHRIVENSLIIYEEYRLHAIVFTLRAILVSVFGLNMHHIPDIYRPYTLALLLLVIHLIVDYITVLYGKPGVTAVRVVDKDKGYKRVGKRLYAFYQFAAIGSHLIIDPFTCDLGFNAVIAIQSSAFLMTLKRKNIIKWYTHAFFYSLCLALSYTYMLYVKGFSFLFYVGIVFIGRVIFDFDKYPLWFAYALLMNSQARI